MTDGRRNISGRAKCVLRPLAVVAMVIGLALGGSQSRADDESPQRIDNAPLRPSGDWVPVPRALLQKFLVEREQRDNAVPPGGAFIKRIVYRGQLQDDLSFRGELRGVVSPAAAVSVLDLQQVSMFLGDLRWEDGLVEWGSTDDGRSVLLVPPNGEALEGRWSLNHRVVGDRIEFRVQALPAASSRFELSLPAGWRLESSAGTVVSSGDNGTGGTTWIVELGRRRECLWTLQRADSPQPGPLVLTEERSHVYSVSEDRCQIHAEFEIRVLRGPVREFRFALPDGFQHSKTTYAYAGNVSLGVRREEEEGKQMLIVPLPELAPGLLKTIEIDGSVPSLLETPWKLPTISLEHARTMVGTRRLRVEMPLAVSTLEPTNLRQTEASFNESGDVDWFFEELNDASALEVELVLRKARIAARIACRIEEQFGDLRCDALVRLNTQSGTWYDTEFRVPPDWEVFDVVPSGGLPDSAISYWRVSEPGRLQVEFRQAASLQSPKAILIRSRAPRSGRSEADWTLPLTIPTGTDDCGVLVAVVVGAQALEIDSTDESAWTESQQRAVEDDWATDLDTLGLRAGNSNEVRFFESSRPFDTARVRIQQADESDAAPAAAGGEAPQPAVPPVGSSAAVVGRLPTLTLALNSRLSAGDSGPDWHEAVFHVIAGQCSDGVSIRLPPEFTPRSVLVNGEPAEYSQEGDLIILTRSGSDVESIEIDYTGSGEPLRWLSRRTLTVVPPVTTGTMEGFRWEVRMPRGCRISRGPSHAFVSSGVHELSLAQRVLGPFFDGRKQPDGSGSVATFTAIVPPDSLTLDLWNADLARVYAWAVFLAAMMLLLLLRQTSGPYWQPAAIVLMLSSATLAASLADVPALLSGSLFAGLVVATLLPRRLIGIRRAAAASPAEVRAARVDQRMGWTAGSIIAGACGLSLVSLSTADDRPLPDAIQAGRVRAIVPDREDEAGGVVYVDDDLAGELADWIAAADPMPRSLLRSVRYIVPADADNVVRAEIDVLVSAGARRVPVRLPLEGVTFHSSESCLVDGVPAPVRPATDGRGLLVEVDGVRHLPGPEEPASGRVGFHNVTITLEFRPRLNLDATVREAGLPVVIDSRLLWKRPVADDRLPEVFHAGTTGETEEGWQVELGPVSELYISTAEKEPGPERRPAAEGQAVSLILLQPRHAQIRTRLEIMRPAQVFGPDPSMPQIVELSGLCDVREVASPDLQAFHVRYRDADRTIVELAFDRFHPGETVVHLDYTRPPSADGQWRFPDAILVDGAPLTEHVVGFASSRGFLIDVDRTVPDADGVQVIVPDTFLELVADEPGWPAPDVAYQLTPPIALPIQLDRLETERSAGVEQTLSVGDDRTTWEALISMNVVGAPATQHRIRLSPDVHVESVSVLQEDAKRLLSWSQNGRDLVIFLTGDRTGAQEILLRGRCPTDAETLREAPTIGIAEATIGKLQTRIENRSGQIVELLNARGELSSVLSPADDDSESTSSRTFDAEAPDAPVRFRMRPPGTAFALESLVAVSTTQMMIGYRPSGSVKGVHDWELVVPAEWGGNFQVEPDAALVRQRAESNGETVLTLRSPNATDIVSLVTPLAVPDDIHWTLPTPALRNTEIVQSSIAVTSDLPFVPDVADDAAIEPDTGWSAWLESLPGQFPSRVVPVRTPDYTLRNRLDEEGGEAAGLLAETLLFSDVDRPASGATVATVMTHQRELILEFAVPDDVGLSTMVFNHQTIEPEWIGERTARFHVVNDQPIGLARFVLNWRGNSPPAGLDVTEAVPTLTLPPAECEFCLVVPSSDQYVALRGGLTPMDHRELHFRRAECLVRILEQVVPGHIVFDDVSQTVTADCAQELAEHLAVLEVQNLDADQAARLAAIEVEWQGIRALMPNDRDMADASDRPAFPPPWELVSPATILVSDSRLVVGTPDPATETWEFVNLSPALIRGMTAAALVSGLLGALMLLRMYLPAAWVRSFHERDTLLGAAILGLLWWLLLPLGFLGLAVCTISLLAEICSLLASRREWPHTL